VPASKVVVPPRPDAPPIVVERKLEQEVVAPRLLRPQLVKAEQVLLVYKVAFPHNYHPMSSVVVDFQWIVWYDADEQQAVSAATELVEQAVPPLVAVESVAAKALVALPGFQYGFHQEL
jgi:hypothetical protein